MAFFRVSSSVTRITKRISAESDARIRKAALHVRKTIRKKVRSRRKSTAGNPPGRLTGRFYDSIKATHFKGESFVGSRSPVAHLLELGTVYRFTKKGKFAGRMKARPVFVPTFQEETHTVQAILSDRWF